MTDEELFTLLVQQLGQPLPLMTATRGGGKAPARMERMQLDFVVEFVSVCGVAGRIIKSEAELRALHRRYTDWWYAESKKLAEAYGLP